MGSQEVVRQKGGANSPLSSQAIADLRRRIALGSES
jgi:hypothetical protein